MRPFAMLVEYNIWNQRHQNAWKRYQNHDFVKYEFRYFLTNSQFSKNRRNGEKLSDSKNISSIYYLATFQKLSV